jgi:hypothetical protein
MTLVRQVLAVVSKRRSVGETLKRLFERAQHTVRGINVVDGDIVPNIVENLDRPQG